MGRVGPDNPGEVEYRALLRDEIPAIWGIDRRERIERIFVARAEGLVLKDLRIDVPGWAAGRAEEETPVFEASFDAGAWFEGAFEGGGLLAFRCSRTSSLEWTGGRFS